MQARAADIWCTLEKELLTTRKDQILYNIEATRQACMFQEHGEQQVATITAQLGRTLHTREASNPRLQRFSAIYIYIVSAGFVQQPIGYILFQTITAVVAVNKRCMILFVRHPVGFLTAFTAIVPDKQQTRHQIYFDSLISSDSFNST